MFLILFTGCTNIQSSTSVRVDNTGKRNESIELTTSSVEEEDKLVIDRKYIVNEQPDGERGMFYLGMTLKELYSLDLYNTDYQITSTIVIEDNNAWDYGHKVIWTPNLCLSVDKEGKLYRITVNGDLSTKLGLKNGDSINVLENLYGKSDAKYKFEWGNIEEYNLGDCYFYVDVNEETINLWGISKYRYNYKENN